MGAALLAGCATRRPRRSAAPEEQDAAQAASPANIASLTEVVQRNPNDAQAYNVRGSVLGRAGRNQEALADFDRAIALDANYAQAYANRGQVHRQMNRLELALADYNKALALDQNYAAAYLGRGQVYRAAGPRARRAQRLQPRDPDDARATGRPITTAACSIRRRGSTSSRSTISRPRSG